MKNELKNVELADGVYWVGEIPKNNELNCNPYLIIDNEEGVLIDPGSVLDFDVVYSNVIELIPLNNIKYVILHHQDPDLCASVPLFEKKGLKAKIVTHWRTTLIIRYYGIKSEYYIVDENDYKLTLSSGRILKFISTPYLHFSGAITTYDTNTKILFSSDLFGAFNSSNWSLFAKEEYIESIKAFHEHYMPGNEILRPVMENLLMMDIKQIAPQHGCIIQDNIKTYIKVLRDLECGTFLNPIKKIISKKDEYLGICNEVIKRLCSVLQKEEINRILINVGIKLNEVTGEIEDSNFTGQELWNKIFEALYKEKGINFLTIMEPFAHKISKEYDVLLPEIVSSKIAEGRKKAIHLSEKNKKLIEINKELKEDVKKIQDKFTVDPISGLYNEAFFLDYLEITFDKHKNSALLLITIDNMTEINFKYGREIGNETIKNLAYFLKNYKNENHEIFRLHGSMFGYYMIDVNKSEAINIAEIIRKNVAKSESFIESITVSIGLVYLKDLENAEDSTEKISSTIFNSALNSLKTARSKGKNIVSSESLTEDSNSERKKVLLVDNDNMSLEILKIYFEKEDFEVIIARDGLEALKMIEKEDISIVISELMLPKLDGFLIKERMSFYSNKANLPFILISHQKDKETIKRAIDLKIDYYFKKPYMIMEVIGFAKNMIKGAER
ncbi:diguanylate cyclase [Clostridium sp. SHJSY1]|uniref:diguanylate cyclase domain-containing protein n=1 Tax=Clostridium sp. SHJSY1 TaxID=2942483 RepID=UPI00287705F5|nr:diguanylate cyclase [Clostridium sp. SHJSY1]MDS0525677.1 diguanylate cyclase [Clostridium sp. SHJSY1]